MHAHMLHTHNVCMRACTHTYIIRWAGLYGIDADYVADEDCKMSTFLVADIRVQRGERR